MAYLDEETACSSPLITIYQTEFCTNDASEFLYFPDQYELYEDAVQHCKNLGGRIADLSKPSLYTEAHTQYTTKVPVSLCVTDPTNGDCCTANPGYCDIGDGDCDSDAECAHGTICGNNNCVRDGSASYGTLTDCCYRQGFRKFKAHNKQ